MIVNGERIKQEMKKKRITQQKLADVIGTERSEVSYWINGKRGMKADAIKALSNYLGIPIDEVTSGMPIKYPEVVKVVRCKDCKHRNTIFCFKEEQGFGTDDDWFCADGERKG